MNIFNADGSENNFIDVVFDKKRFQKDPINKYINK